MRIDKYILELLKLLQMSGWLLRYGLNKFQPRKMQKMIDFSRVPKFAGSAYCRFWSFHFRPDSNVRTSNRNMIYGGSASTFTSNDEHQCDNTRRKTGQ